jgi:hypothetical protein
MHCQPFWPSFAPLITRLLTAIVTVTCFLEAVAGGQPPQCSPAAPPQCSPSSPAEGAILDAAQLTAYIDQALSDAWARASLKPAAPADDAEFLRRASLDVVGKIPSIAALQEFLADTLPDKRARAVDDLLRKGAHAQHFANTWRGLMLAGAAESPETSSLIPQFEIWLRLRFAVNAPYDRMVTELLNSPTEVQAPATRARVQAVPSPSAFFQANEQKPEQLAASTTRIFLGVQVQCAQCHDHPFSHWTRREFWSMAAFFDRPTMMAGAAESPKPDKTSGSLNAVLIPGTQVVVEPTFLDGSQPDWAGGSAKRDLLARWITQSDNPFFARAAVNRLWEHFLGRGFVHPVDDLDKANPPSHPELLDEMARQFALHHYDLNHLIRAITGTRAYQLSSRADSKGEDDLAQFAHMPLRRMTSDQLFASIVQATGFREGPRVTQRGALPDLTGAAAEFRQRFADQSVSRTEAETSILQALALMNGKLVSDATDLEKSETLAAVAEAPFLSNPERVEALFMTALSRKPAPEELAPLVEHVERGGVEQNPKKALADVFWALVNSAEFALNH